MLLRDCSHTSNIGQTGLANLITADDSNSFVILAFELGVDPSTKRISALGADPSLDVTNSNGHGTSWLEVGWECDGTRGCLQSVLSQSKDFSGVVMKFVPNFGLGDIQLVLTEHGMINLHIPEMLTGCMVGIKFTQVKPIDILHIDPGDIVRLVYL
jgi:hypothetical protein